jgi:hypothetical protein
MAGIALSVHRSGSTFKDLALIGFHLLILPVSEDKSERCSIA